MMTETRNRVIVEDRRNRVIVEQTTQVVEAPETDAGVVRIGIQGPPGPPGPTSADNNFVLSFSNTSSVTVSHNLGKYPAVSVANSAYDECEGLSST